MQLSAQYRKTPPPPPPVPAEAAEHTAAAPPVVDVDDEAPYLGAWLGYKRRWREIWLNGVVGWITLAVLALLLERTDGGPTVLAVLWPVWGMVWFVMTAISALRIMAFSCPRCGNSFFTLGKPMTSQLKCRHCGLRKFQVNDAGKSLWQLKRPE
jgi:DNA-directed RNA polymerase subunit RPC12/RpoP